MMKNQGRLQQKTPTINMVDYDVTIQLEGVRHSFCIQCFTEQGAFYYALHKLADKCNKQFKAIGVAVVKENKYKITERMEEDGKRSF